MTCRQLWVLVLACASAVACSSANRLERAEALRDDHEREASQERVKLEAKQREQQEALSRRMAEEHERLEQDESRTAGAVDKDLRDVEKATQELREERAEFERDTLRERSDLNADQAAETAKVNQRWSKTAAADQERIDAAASRVQEQRETLAADSREELSELTLRADTLQAKVQSTDIENQREVRSTLAGVPEQRAAIERDIDALETVRAENLQRTRANIKNKLSALDNALDNAESNF